MGFSDALSRIHLPDIKSFLGLYQNAGTEIQKSKINKIKVLFFSKDFQYCQTSYGELTYNIESPVVDISIPDDLSIIVRDQTIYFDEIDKEKFIISVAGHPYSLNLRSLFFEEKEIQISKKESILLNQKIIYQLGHAKILERLDKHDNDGLIIATIIGGLLGVVAGIVIGFYMFVG